MTRTFVEVMDLREVETKLMRQLRLASFGESGWMTECIDQILQGYAVRYDWVQGAPGEEWDGQVEKRHQALNYNRAHALIARDEEGTFLGWAMVRHPQRVVKLPNTRWEIEEQGVPLFAYGGRRPDFMVYVFKKYRGRDRAVARNLLLVAYNNFGRMDVYPHGHHTDNASTRFYERNAQFVQAHHTDDFTNGKYHTREIF